MIDSRMVTALLALSMTACASLPESAGEVARLTREHGLVSPQTDDAAAFSRERLAAPLSADDAVQLALINNPDVRVAAGRLGLAAAEVYEAGRLANPVLSASSLSAGAAPHAQLTLGVGLRFVELLTLPATHRQAQAQYQAARLDVSAASLDLAGRVQGAWFEAAAAEQAAQVRELAERAGRNAADIAQRYFDAGNINRRQLAAEQAAATRARLDALTARSASNSARYRLNRLMGLDAAQAKWTLQKLPESLPATEALEVLLPMAMDSRMDLAASRQRAQALASRYGLQRRTRMISGIEIGAERERDFDGSVHWGPTLSIELPLFDWGRGRVARAAAELDVTEAALDAQVLDASRDIGEAWTRAQAAQGLAKSYRDELMPQRAIVVEQLQAEVNSMLAGVFDLLTARREEYEAYVGYIEALRDGWIARADLTRAVGRVLPQARSEPPTAPVPDPLPQAQSPATEEANPHSHMHHMPAPQVGEHSEGAH